MSMSDFAVYAAAAAVAIGIGAAVDYYTPPPAPTVVVHEVEPYDIKKDPIAQRIMSIRETKELIQALRPERPSFQQKLSEEMDDKGLQYCREAHSTADGYNRCRRTWRR